MAKANGKLDIEDWLASKGISLADKFKDEIELMQYLLEGKKRHKKGGSIIKSKYSKGGGVKKSKYSL